MFNLAAHLFKIDHMRLLILSLFMFIISNNVFGQTNLQSSKDHQMLIKLTGDKLHIQDSLKQPNLKPQQKKVLTKKLEKTNQSIKEFSNLSNYYILLDNDDKKEYNEVVSESEKINGMTYKEKLDLITRLAQLHDNQRLLLLIAQGNK